MLRNDGRMVPRQGEINYAAFADRKFRVMVLSGEPADVLFLKYNLGMDIRAILQDRTPPPFKRRKHQAT